MPLDTQVPRVRSARAGSPASSLSCWDRLEESAPCPHLSVCPDAPTTKSSLWTRKDAKGSQGQAAQDSLGWVPQWHPQAASGPLRLSFGHLLAVAWGSLPFCARAARLNNSPSPPTAKTALPLAQLPPGTFLPTHRTPITSPGEFSLEGTSGRWQRFHLELFNVSTYTHNYKRIRIDKNIFFP